MVRLNCFLVLFLFGIIPFVAGNDVHFTEYLDPQSKYELSWGVNLTENTIYFQVAVETTGFVGVGLSGNGQMDGADLFIAGVKDGVPYSQDMHGVDHSPILDTTQDWVLTKAEENTTHTSLSFHRLLDTCDPEDYAITTGTTKLIWSFGETDVIGYHGTNRGASSVSFLTPERPPWDPSKYEKYTILNEFTMPSGDTTYWCTVHKGPEIKGKTHIVAFEAYLPNEHAIRHTHHFSLMMCKTPVGENATEYFDKFLGEGNNCYDLPENKTLPFKECQEYLYVWAVGGKPSFFPDEMGYPFGESGEPIYYMLETHYDNPSLVEGLTFETGLNFYYTSDLRPTDAGLMWTPHETNMGLVIPPNTPDFVLSAHCDPTCTDYLPAEGIKIFNVLLHSHKAGRQMKLRHFRNGKELPWILNDPHYDFDFQQNAHLPAEVTVLPGDQLTIECVMDSTDRNGDVVVGGFSSRKEMCEAIFWYYPKTELVSCGSYYPLAQALKEYGVTNYTIDYENYETSMPIIWAPESLAGPNGTDFMTVLNTRYNWTNEFIAYMRESRRYGVHQNHCRVEGLDLIEGESKYPQFDEEYEPDNPCTTR